MRGFLTILTLCYSVDLGAPATMIRQYPPNSFIEVRAEGGLTVNVIIRSPNIATFSAPTASLLSKIYAEIESRTVDTPALVIRPINLTREEIGLINITVEFTAWPTFSGLIYATAFSGSTVNVNQNVPCNCQNIPVGIVLHAQEGSVIRAVVNIFQVVSILLDSSFTTVSGRSQISVVTVNGVNGGAGLFVGLNLETNVTRIQVRGSAQLGLNSRDRIQGTVEGSAQILYKGNPVIDVVTNGDTQFVRV